MFESLFAQHMDTTDNLQIKFITSFYTSSYVTCFKNTLDNGCTRETFITPVLKIL